MKALASIFLVFWLSSCASIHTGEKAVAETSEKAVKEGEEGKKSDFEGLYITGEEVKELSSEYFGLLEVTFENKTARWINVSDIKISMGDEETDKNILVTLGSDLKLWKDAVVKKRQVDNFNTQMVLAGIGLVGAGLVGASADSGSMNTFAAGGSLMLGASAVSLGKGINDQLNAIQRGKLKVESKRQMPEGHLLSSFSVPPGLFVKKWIVIQTKPGQKVLKSMRMRFKGAYREHQGATQKQVEEKLASYTLEFRDLSSVGGNFTGSDWQQNALKSCVDQHEYERMVYPEKCVASL